MKAGSSVAAGVVLVVQEYVAHCSKMDKFVQKLYYAHWLDTNSIVAPLWDPKLGRILWDIFLHCSLGTVFYQVFYHFLKFDVGFFGSCFWTFLNFFRFIATTERSKSVKAKDENNFDGE